MGFAPDVPVVGVPAPQDAILALAPGPDGTRFERLCCAHELHPTVQRDLLAVLCGADVVILCDDSSSMRQAIAEEGIGAFSPKRSTRWLEQQKLVARVVEFVTAVQSDAGCEVRFLNRPGATGVTAPHQLASFFAAPPAGGTPLYGALRRILDDDGARRRQGSPSPVRPQLLVIVITDGEPGDCTRAQLLALLLGKGPHVHVSVAECTDDEYNCAWLDEFDGRVPNFDNSDDFRVELARVRNVMGPDFKFGTAEYTCKIILASFLRWWFALDQARGSWDASPVWYRPRVVGPGPGGVYGSGAGGGGYGGYGVGGYGVGVGYGVSGYGVGGTVGYRANPCCSVQ